MRVGNHLINLASIHQVTLGEDESATLLLQGPRKALQILKVDAPAGRELWNFVYQNLSVVEFELRREDAKPRKDKKSAKKAETK
jgi:hypothetical protein